jgi:hypothetical protein
VLCSSICSFKLLIWALSSFSLFWKDSKTSSLALLIRYN